MNPYLSKNEKEHLIRLFLLRASIEAVVDVYEKLRHTDKGFLSELRHANTRIKKAINLRLGYLTPDALTDLEVSANKLHVRFLPTPEAKKVLEEALKLKSTYPISADDFQDWYCFVIESTCKICNRADYEECPARRILKKYSVYAVNPAAKGCCEYSYLEAVIGGIGNSLLKVMA